MENLEVNPPLALPLGEVISVDKVLGDIIDLDLNIFRPIHRGGQVEIGHAKARKFGV